MGQGWLFGQRKESLFSKVDVLNEADFHRGHLSERVGQKTVECRCDENKGNEGVEPSVRFMYVRRDGQHDESAEESEGSVNYDLK